jgi:hypothetical protein
MFMHLYGSGVGVVLLILNILAMGFSDTLLPDYIVTINIQEKYALNHLAPELNIHCDEQK